MSGPGPRRRPVSSYRLQLTPEFGFARAAAVAPYLQRLGVTECYSAPVLESAPDSTHGYDVCDHGRIDTALGGEEGFASFAGALHRHGMGLILDFVPNHMSVHPEANRWWRSVLEHGPSSPYAKYFDIDWDPVKDELKGKLLLPILEDQYGVVLEGGHLQLEHAGCAIGLRYGDLTLPLNPRRLGLLLRHDLDTLETDLGRGHEDFSELQSILFQLEHLPAYTDTDAASVEARTREKEIARSRLEALVRRNDRIRGHLDGVIRRFNGIPGDGASFDLLHELLEAQAYRLSFWRTATDEINYRRFFDINQLAGIRMDDPNVFAETHRLLGDLLRRGIVTGVRLDHTDGLLDPAAYLERLAGVTGPAARPYVVVEKVLTEGECLPDTWETDGTTGYDFLNDLNGLFVDGSQAKEMMRLYVRFTGRTRTCDDEVYAGKKLIIATSMASELNVLAYELNRMSEGHRRFRDFTLDSLRAALREVVACFPVYRSYVSAHGWTDRDGLAVDSAVSEALGRNPAMEPSIFDFIRSMLLPSRSAGGNDRDRQLLFAMKFQQYTGPVQAKGVEDTAFYRYAPLVSLNEVGGNPARFGRSPEEFHDANRRRLAAWPLTMLATSTHDTKRGEDARARINVLSEIPKPWRVAVSRWSRANASARGMARSRPAPDRGDEYLFYQALVGAWPPGLKDVPDRSFVDRIKAYMLKAVKEAKIHTSWVSPFEEYDRAVARFVERALEGPNARTFIPLFVQFHERIARLGMVNSLSQIVLKVASPGVPDFYQGTELWDLSLVDPDNRRPVDFDRRSSWLGGLEHVLDHHGPIGGRLAEVADMLANWEDGRIKLYCTAACLRARRSFTDVFLEGAYEPLAVQGDQAGHVVAFARTLGKEQVIAMAPRLVAGLCGSGTVIPTGTDTWGDTLIVVPGRAPARFTNLLTGERVERHLTGGRAVISVAGALRTVPATLLVSEGMEGSR